MITEESEKTFKPIIVDPVGFAKASAIFNPLRAFFEPSNGTKIFFNVL